MEKILPTQALLQWKDEKPNTTFLRQIDQRQFVDYRFQDVANQALTITAALQNLGLERGDKVALMSKNCAEWFITDLAMMFGGFISVPIFPTAGKETIEHVLSHSESKVLFIGKLDSTKVIEEIDLTNLTTISLPYPTTSCQHTWQSLLESNTPITNIQHPEFKDVMSIVYTSGTSGLPKGAVLTYEGFSWTSIQLIKHLQLADNERLFSYLPLAHITERVYILGTSVIGGVQVAFPESLETFIDDVKMQRPTLFVSVPRLWTLFQQRILEKLPQKKLNFLLKIPFVSSLIKKKLADGLGLDQARVLGCGSAPVSAGLLRWYESIGLNITEAWGMTESFAYGTINYPFNSDKIGTVGHASLGVEIKIAEEDGEILVRSEGLFAGYYKNPEATAETIIDGWLHTGDIGSLDNQGYLSIQGRKNDTFKTAKGKFVSPVPIEKRIFELTKIEQLCVVGSGMPGPILLAIPHHFPNFDRQRYLKKLNRALKQINSELESHAKIRGILVIDEPWSIDNGILTPTLKIRRHMLEKNYHDIGLNWPNDKQVIWEDEL
ncbi:AMP-binding protein [Vibrio sp. SS-MA-C1-2]|uniref:AMP-binding protein n=1 Tax=Vibrio sp. SS-MA-C1-2 TaxID=2908646 RepID=UPI001F3A0D9A|nr:AMP-binding protein [Vibrio sp. SS-MA-C1-2]UJF16843.1 AMP-binding protein [Vibrio sp. SS-MA-C1-2]